MQESQAVTKKRKDPSFARAMLPSAELPVTNGPGVIEPKPSYNRMHAVCMCAMFAIAVQYYVIS